MNALAGLMSVVDARRSRLGFLRIICGLAQGHQRLHRSVQATTLLASMPARAMSGTSRADHAADYRVGRAEGSFSTTPGQLHTAGIQASAHVLRSSER
jgi:hypothetical protein